MVEPRTPEKGVGVGDDCGPLCHVVSLTKTHLLPESTGYILRKRWSRPKITEKKNPVDGDAKHQ